MRAASTPNFSAVGGSAAQSVAWGLSCDIGGGILLGLDDRIARTGCSRTTTDETTGGNHHHSSGHAAGGARH